MGRTTKTGRPRRPPLPWESALWSALVAQAYERIDKRYRDADADYFAKHGRGLYDLQSEAYPQLVARCALEEGDEAYGILQAAYWRREREREEKAKAAKASGGAR